MKKQIPTLAAVLMALLSLAGLFFQSAFYPTQALQRAFVSNDVVNLLVGLPALLVSLSLARRASWLGVLLLPGALLYVTYNYIAYTIATWANAQSFFYIVLAVLSVWSAVQSFVNIDAHGIQSKLHGMVPARFAGGVLMAFGLVFFFRGIAQVYTALSNSAALATPELSVAYADLLITPLWVLGGLALWRRGARGYAVGTGLLFQASALFAGLLIFFILQPFLTGAEFPAADFAVIFGMGLFFFIPFGLFVKGVLRAS